MGNPGFSARAPETALPDSGDPPSLLWTFGLVAAMSAVAFTAVWFITAALIAAPLP